MEKSKTLVVKRKKTVDYQEKIRSEFGDEYLMDNLAISWDQYYQNLKRSGVLRIAGSLFLPFEISEQESLSVNKKGVLIGFPSLYQSVLSVSLSYNHMAILMADSCLYMWGDNTLGQLGLNKVLETSKPILVHNKIREVKCSPGNTYLLTYDNDLYFCGLDIKQDLSDITKLDFEDLINNKIDDRYIATTDFISAQVKEFSPGLTSISYIDQDSNLYYLGNLSNLPHQADPYYITSNVNKISSRFQTLSFIDSKKNLYVYGQSLVDENIYDDPKLITKELVAHVSVGFGFLVFVTTKNRLHVVNLFSNLASKSYKLSADISSLQSGDIGYIYLTTKNEAFFQGNYLSHPSDIFDDHLTLKNPENAKIQFVETGGLALALII